MLRCFKNLHHSVLAASDGHIGHIREVYFDDTNWKVRYFRVATGSWLLGREVLVAPRVIEGIDEIHRAMAVHLTQKQVRDSPPVSSDKPVSRQYEEAMHQHYGWDPYWSYSDLGTGFCIPFASSFAASSAVAVADQPAKVATHLRTSGEVHGYKIHALDGELGQVEDFVLDDTNWSLRYLVVRSGKWTDHTHILLSPEWIERISYEDSEVVVNLMVAQIRNAPVYDPSQPITREFEDRLHTYYEREGYWLPQN